MIRAKMAGEEETEEERQAKMYRRNTKRLRRNLLERFLMAMKEDLAEWLSSLTDIDMNAINFMNKLDNGVLLCEHANLVQKHAEEYISKLDVEHKIKIPTCRVYYREKGAFKGSFIARDNVANFISWCKDFGIPDVVLFETEDLVLHKNEKTVVLTLLDVARKAAKFGVKPPQLVELEEEIDREIEEDKKDSIKNKNRVEKVLELEEENDLDQLVHDVVDTCTCSSQFPVKKLGDGKYKFGNNKQLIFVRVMRNHVMVRVGGGWDTLEHYIDKHDPCRLHVAGKVNRQGRAEKIPARKLSAMMEVNSDEASVCSSESFGSGDGRIFSSISPDSDLSSELSLSACSSHRSSMHQDSDDESCTIQTSRSEPLSTRHPKDDNDIAIRETKSETFTKFSNRKLSLMDYNLKDSDIYLTRNPGDSWLRKQLNERKLSTHTKEQTEKVPGDPEPTGKENMTVESIKKKYGRPVKQRSQKRDGKSTPNTRRRTTTNPYPSKEEDNEKMPRLQPRNHPQYRSWDQSVVAVKRRKDTVRGIGQSSEANGAKRGSSQDITKQGITSGIPRLVMTPQRPSFYKSYTLDVASLNSRGVRRRGSDASMNPQPMQRETSTDSISRHRNSKLPVPTFHKTVQKINSVSKMQNIGTGDKPMRSRNPVSRSSSTKSNGSTPVRKNGLT